RRPAGPDPGGARGRVRAPAPRRRGQGQGRPRGGQGLRLNDDRQPRRPAGRRAGLPRRRPRPPRRAQGAARRGLGAAGLALEGLAGGLLEAGLGLAGPGPVARLGGARRPRLLLAPGLVHPRLLAGGGGGVLGPLDPLGLAFARLGGRRRVAVDARRPRLLRRVALGPILAGLPRLARRIAVGARLAEGLVAAFRPVALRLVPLAQAALARRR